MQEGCQANTWTIRAVSSNSNTKGADFFRVEQSFLESFRKWKAAQKKPRAVLVELTTVSAKHRAFKASSCLRASHEDLTPQQMQQRKGLSSDFLGLKVRGFKPFFRGTTLKYRDGGVVRQCAKGGANKISASSYSSRPSPSPQT